MRNVVLSVAIIGAIGAIFGGMACSQGPTGSSGPVASSIVTPGTPAPEDPTAGGTTGSTGTTGPHELADFIATVDHKAKTMVFTKVPVGYADDESGGGTVTPDSWNVLSYDASGGDNPPATSTIDLVSANCIDGYPGSPTFQCDVTLTSGYARPLANVYVQISNAKVGGVTVATYNANNSTSPYTTANDGTLPVSHGLWSYTNASVNANADCNSNGIGACPLLGADGSGANSGLVTWMFDNPGDANVVYTIKVYATEFFAQYSVENSNNADGTYGNMNYIDACTGGTSITSGSSTAITLPFDFTLFNQDSNAIKLCQVGGIAMGTAACPADTKIPIDLTAGSATIGNPIFFAFWDRLKFGTAANDKAPADSTKKAGQICYKPVPGFTTSPNQIEVIEWRNMQFLEAPGTKDSLDFEAFLYEGTGEVDLFYNNMAAGSDDAVGRNTCDDTTANFMCWVGAQGKDSAGTVLTGGGNNTTTFGWGIFGSNDVGSSANGASNQSFSFYALP